MRHGLSSCMFQLMCGEKMFACFYACMYMTPMSLRDNIKRQYKHAHRKNRASVFQLITLNCVLIVKEMHVERKGVAERDGGERKQQQEGEKGNVNQNKYQCNHSKLVGLG